jgi:predicted DNA-binding WGR domain protein
MRWRVEAVSLGHMSRTKKAATKRSAIGSAAARPTTKEYRALVDARLDELRPSLVRELREHVFVFPIPEHAKSLDYEILDTAFGGKPSIAGYFMDGDGGQIWIPKRGGPAPYVALRTSEKRLLAASVARRFEDAGVDTMEINGSAIRRWFIDGWKAAGGRTRFHLLASICFHDGDPTPLPNAAPARLRRRKPTQFRVHRLKNRRIGKFWEGQIRGVEIVVFSGMIDGRYSKKVQVFSTTAIANDELEALLQEKLREGYVEG